MAQQRNILGAVVLGSDFKALGVIRSLGKRGIPSIVIDNLPRSAWTSRYVVKRFQWQGELGGIQLLNFLQNLCKQEHLEQWLLIPTQDETVEFAAHYTQELGQLYQPVTQGWEVIKWALDKRLTYQMAQELAVAYPRTWYPGTEDNLHNLEIAFPVIIKPAVSIRFQHATRLKALPATTQQELLAQYRLAAQCIPSDEIMIQEIIPGTGNTQYSVATYCKNGEVLLNLTAKRIRQYPIDYGLGSSFVEAVEVPGLLEPAARLLHHMAVSGMVEVEFKYDQRDKTYKLLDINVRPWGWHTLCIACGLDFPSIQYNDILGETPPTITPRYGYHWVRMLTDIPAGIQEIQAGITTPGAYLRSLTGKTVFSVFDWRDPLPAVGDLASAFTRVAKGLLKR